MAGNTQQNLVARLIARSAQKKGIVDQSNNYFTKPSSLQIYARHDVHKKLTIQYMIYHS